MIADACAISIMDLLHRAEADLVGARVIAVSGEAGIVLAVKLDDHHGLCFTFDEQHPSHASRMAEGRRFYPVSTIRMKLRAQS